MIHWSFRQKELEDPDPEFGHSHSLSFHLLVSLMCVIR